jgi:tetratricopeptide (TPR) repeat protein
MKKVALQEVRIIAPGVLELIDDGQFVDAEKQLSQISRLDDPMLRVAKAEVEIYFARINEAAEVLGEVAPEIEDIHLAARYALTRGELLYWRYEQEQAEEQLQAAYHIYKFLGDDVRVANALYNLGRLRRRQSHYDEAQAMLGRGREMLETEETTRGDFLRGLIDFNLGVCKHELGDLAAARELYESALRLLRETEGCRYYGLALNIYGALFTRIGEYPKALAYLREASEIFSRIGTLDDLARTTSNLAWTFIRLKDLNQAERYLQESVELHQRIGDISGTSLCLKLFAQLHLEAGNLNEAKRFASQAVEQADLGHDDFGMSDALIIAGQVAFRLGDYWNAEKSLGTALDLANKLDSKMLQTHGYLYLAEASLPTSPVKGREYLAKAAGLLTEYHDPWLDNELERISQRYKGERISITDDNRLVINGNLLPTWASAKEAVEKFLLKNALEQTEGNQTKAGQLLSITKVHVHEKRKQYGI